MFCIYKNILSKNNLTSLKNLISSKTLNYSNNEKFNQNIKHEFYSNKYFKNIKIILKEIEFNNILTHLKKPSIDHIQCLFKPIKSIKTPFHQDIFFWNYKEELFKSSMFTCWIPLEDINKNHGALTFNHKNIEYDLKNINHAQQVYKHSKKILNSKIDYVIDDASFDGKDFKPFEVNIGDVVLFDSYEVHGSTENLLDKARLSFKIVFGELNAHRMSGINPIYSYKYNVQFLKKKIFNLNNKILKKFN